MPSTSNQLLPSTAVLLNNQHAELQPENLNSTVNQTYQYTDPERSEQNHEQTRPARPQKALNKKGQRHRNNITIGSLNINGLHTGTNGNRAFCKWTEVHATMKKERIAVLAVQETHLDKTNTQGVLRAFGKRLTIHNSQRELNPRSSARVAFVLNKELIKTDQVETFELIKGRALAIKLTWTNNEEISLINVYAPNRRSEHENFWEEVRKEWESLNQGNPDFILGDFNITEDPIDRSPAKHDNAMATRK